MGKLALYWAAIGIAIIISFWADGIMLFNPNWFPNNAATILFTAVFVIWLFSEAVNTIISRMSAGGKKKDKGSYWAVMAGIFISIILLFLLRGMKIGTYSNSIQYIGIALIFLGTLFRQWAVFTLGSSFTVKVETDNSRELTTSGPYKYLRHPSYIGGIIIITGVALALGTWVGLIIAEAVIWAGYSYRIKVEEEALSEAFGRKYHEYKKKTWKLFPFI